MVIVHGTRKFLERVGEPRSEPAASTTKLGDWYATVLFWRPQAALFVNEATLLPVVVPFSPASGVVDRFRAVLAGTLLSHGCSLAFIEEEIAAMKDHILDKTRSRSVLGIMNEFSYLANVYRVQDPAIDLQTLSDRLAHTPCGPLYETHVFPDRALIARRGRDLKRERTTLASCDGSLGHRIAHLFAHLLQTISRTRRTWRTVACAMSSLKTRGATHRTTPAPFAT